MVTAVCRWSGMLQMLLCVLLSLSLGCVAPRNGNPDPEKNVDHTLTVTGKVQRISLEEGLLVIASSKGERISLKFTEQTVVEGGARRDIAKSQPVKAVYTVATGQNHLVSLEILLQGSCSGN